MTPKDSVIIEETADYPIRSIYRVYNCGKYIAVVGYHDDYVVLRSAETGKILYSYDIGNNIVDSVFTDHPDSLRLLVGCYSQDGLQRYAASRKVASMDDQAQSFAHEVYSVEVQWPLLTITADIRGIIYSSEMGSYRYAVCPLKAILSVNIALDSLVSVTRLPLWSKEYDFISFYLDPSHSHVIASAVNIPWLDNKGTFRQYTMCDYNIHTGDFHYFAERDSGNLKYKSEQPMAVWHNGRCLYANGTDECVYSMDDSKEYELPCLPSEEAGAPSDRRRSIRGIFCRDSVVGVYCILTAGRTTRHLVYIYEASTYKYTGTVECEAAQGRILYCVLDDPKTVSVYVKKQDITRFVYSVTY
jgi:hypothetical protein